jgi:hypothetical protein
MELYYIDDFKNPCPYCGKDYTHLAGVERMSTCGSAECLRKKYLEGTE